MIIAIDFDGTIVQHEYPYIGKPRPGAKEVINQLKADGHDIIIWTCRFGKPANEAKEYLEQNGILFDKINAESDIILEHGWPGFSPKIYADIYIDDRQVGGLPSWHVIYDLIQAQYEKQ